MKRIHQEQPRKSVNTLFQIITLSVAMETSGQIWPNVELIQALMLSLPASMKRIRLRTAEWRHHFSHYKPMGIFSDSAVGGPIKPKFKLLQALMHVIIACKYKKEWIKNSREKVETPFFPSQPYLLPWKPVIGFDPISNSSKLSCVLSIPASMKRIRSRTTEKKWRHRFSHYKPMGIFLDVQGQLTPQSKVQSG